MAAALLEWETLDAEQLNDIMAGKPPRPPKVPASSGSTPPPSTDGPTGATATAAS
jgi:cell division protease FtsH